jgi:hypothetical protein
MIQKSSNGINAAELRGLQAILFLPSTSYGHSEPYRQSPKAVARSGGRQC